MITLDVPLPSDTGVCVVRQNPIGSGRLVSLYLPAEKTATAITTLQVQRDTHYMLPLAAIAHDPRFGAPADRAQTLMTRCDVPASDRGQVTR